MTLTEIANSLGTDKGTQHFECHSYTETYQKYFQPIKDEKIKMLEIGIADPRFPGASIQMWNNFFSDLVYNSIKDLLFFFRLIRISIFFFSSSACNLPDFKSLFILSWF